MKQSRSAIVVLLLALSIIVGYPLPLAHASTGPCSTNPCDIVYVNSCSLTGTAFSEGSETALNGIIGGDSQVSNCTNGKAQGVGTLWDSSGALAVVPGAATNSRVVSFVDGTFTINNVGQLYTSVTLSGYYDVYGYLRNYAYAIGLGKSSSHSSLQLSMEVWPQIPTGPTPAAGTFFDESWSPPADCNLGPVALWPPVVNTCTEDLPIQGAIYFNHQFNLQPGIYYVVVYFKDSTHSSAWGDAQAVGLACFEASSFCTNPPFGAGGPGAPPLAPKNGCPSGVTSPCYYLQWKDTTYQLTDVFAGPAGYSVTPQRTVTSNPSSYVPGYAGVTNPQNAFSPDGQYTIFDDSCSSCWFSDAYEWYQGYSVNLPVGATITKVEVLALHYEQVTFATASLSITAQINNSSKTFWLPFRSAAGLDIFDITSLYSSWTPSKLGNVAVQYYTSLGTAYLDWLALRVTYTLPHVYQNGPSWWQPVNITAVNGFSGTVSFSSVVSTVGVQNPPSVSITPTTLSVSSAPPAPGLPATYILTLNVSATLSTSSGNYTVTITASGGGISRTATVNFLVALVDPTVTFVLTKSTVYQGVNNTIGINLTEANFGNIPEVAETVYFLANGNQIGSWSPSTNKLSPGQLLSGSITWNVATLNVGIYNVTAYVQSIQFQWQATNRMMARFDVDPVRADFSPSTSTNTVHVALGGGGQVKVNLSPLNGFSGGVTANGSLSSAGLSWDISPTLPIQANAHASAYVNGTATSATVVINATQTATLGSYNINLAVSSDLPLSHSITLNVLVIPPFTVAANPSSLSVNAASSISTTLTVSSNGFSGSVSLSAASSDHGLGFTFSSNPVPVSLSVSATSTLTISAPCDDLSTHTVIMTGTAGVMSNSTNITISITNTTTCGFGISANPVSLTITNGTSGYSTLSLSSFNGFSGNLRLDPSAPSGISATPTLWTVSLSSGQTVTDSLNIYVSSSMGSGGYTVSVWATDSVGFDHVVNITVYVGQTGTFGGGGGGGGHHPNSPL